MKVYLECEGWSESLQKSNSNLTHYCIVLILQKLFDITEWSQKKYYDIVLVGLRQPVRNK